MPRMDAPEATGPTRDAASVRRDVRRAYRILRRRNGHLDWWPGRTPLEVVVGAILTQNTSWTNVERAIAALARGRLMSLRALRRATPAELERAIRPSGYFRQKARKLKAFVALCDTRYAGSLARMGRTPTASLRDALLATWGIGPETADSILLYAFDRPVFVVDAYTARVAQRHAWVAAGCGYHALQRFFQEQLRGARVRAHPGGPRLERVALYNDYHAQLVWVGKHHCRPRPRCAACPLRPLLPASDRRDSDRSPAHLGSSGRRSPRALHPGPRSRP